VLFDRAVQAKCVITNVSKKTCTVLVQGVVQTHQLKPAITVLLPFLKREALEDALYSCVELGATDIQLIYTKKVHRADCDEKQMQRLQAIVVAAAEQSKNFAFPVLKAPVALPHALSALSDNSVRLFFHGNGASFNQMVDLLRANTPQNIALMVGPEGDCTDEEIILLQGHQFKSFCLTPTVLRSRQALAVGLGAVRSIVSQNNFEE
jgi:16S rRNA (uracil1498-N3)-methyltransferase